MSIYELFQTSSAIAAIIMIQIGTSWIKQYALSAARAR